MNKHPEAGGIEPFQLRFMIGVSRLCLGEGKGGIVSSFDWGIG
jgi:hypothetical protein